MQQMPPAWLEQLDEILSLLEGQPEAEQETRLIERLTTLDPDLLAFLLDQLAEQESSQAAALFARLAAQPNVPDAVRERARAALDGLARKGIRPPKPGEESFYAGRVQEGRERGEQILALAWRLPDESIEALVFLLDWRGDGLKDYYRTRGMTEAEWDELIAHNTAKGAPMVDIAPPEARALVEAAMAESRRFSRPLPRDYRLDASLVDRRLLRAVEAPTPDAIRSFITPGLPPEDVARAYVAALHYRDYALAAALLAPDHALRVGRSLAEAADALRAALKHAPRRESEAEARLITPDVSSDVAQRDTANEAVVEMDGTEIVMERSGKRRRQPVAETYRLSKVSQTWKILAIEPANRV